jgi:hypothetical protein
LCKGAEQAFRRFEAGEWKMPGHMKGFSVHTHFLMPSLANAEVKTGVGKDIKRAMLSTTLIEERIPSASRTCGAVMRGGS